MPQETCIDVPKAAIVRLLTAGYKRLAKERAHVILSYWAGYCRALEHVLEMEDE